MSGCFSWIILLAAAVFGMVSLLRWFEMTSDAVDHEQWSRLALLVFAPLTVWLYPSTVATGRPVMPPRHEPVRGFGGLPKGGIQESAPEIPASTSAAPSTDAPPPGTPAEFLGMPKIPPKKAPRAIDPDKLAKLKQKMKEQGMLGDEE